MKEILDGLKQFIIPIIIGLITYPVVHFVKYKGIIIKNPSVVSNDVLRYPLFVTNDDSYSFVIITFNIEDTQQCVNGVQRMIVSPVPKDINWVNSSVSRYGTYSEETRSIRISKLTKGEYVLEVPLVFKTENKSFIHGKTGNLVFRQKQNATGEPQPFSDLTQYRTVHWIYFHPLITSVALFVISVVVVITIKKLKRQKP